MRDTERNVTPVHFCGKNVSGDDFLELDHIRGAKDRSAKHAVMLLCSETSLSRRTDGTFPELSQMYSRKSICSMLA